MDPTVKKLVEKSTKTVALLHDHAARQMLERNGIKWSDNIDILKRRLDAAGYELLRDPSLGTPDTGITHRIRLIKTVDSLDYTINATLTGEFGEEKNHDI